MSNFLFYLYRIAFYACDLYSLFIIVDAIMSWIPAVSQSNIGRWIDGIVEPFISLFRRGPILRLIYATGIDISSIIALFVIYFVQDYALTWLFNILSRIFV